ncbi:PF20097 family protein [Fusibacter bizertensis]
MKCPYCDGKMEDGILQAHRYILWTKKQHKLSYRPKDGDILIGEKAIADVAPKASICKSCQKIILDYSDLG